MLFKNEISKLAKSYVKDTSGQFAVLFAVSSALLLSAAGIGIEVTNQVKIKSQLQNVSDAAALLVMRSDAQTESEARQIVRGYVEEHLSLIHI